MKILMLTNIYPLGEMIKKGLTPVVNYFCEEWVKEGHEVFVANNTSRFPFFYYMLPQFVNTIIENRLGMRPPDKFTNKQMLVKVNGVTVFQLPYYKSYPGQLISDKTLNHQFMSICDVLEARDFVPDIVLAHWVNPQIQLIRLFKNKYKGIKTSLVIHANLSPRELSIVKENIDCLDFMGFRNASMRLDTLSKLDLSNLRIFDCYSGVRDYYGLSEQDFSFKEVNYAPLRISFVGNLIHRKFPLALLQAANRVSNFELDISFVGDGPEMDNLRKFITHENVNVNFMGKLDRERVYSVLEQTSVFIMISKNEAFGLVYLEAMLNRNIVIASKNDGFDGIIKDGINGFLCNAGDSDELSQILIKILNMPREKLLEIQKESFLTASKMTDAKMAHRYLEIVEEL